MQNSGKLLIIAMLLVGLVAGGVSWWFRYSATHRAALFWGPEAARLIRDAPRVELLRLERVDSQEEQEDDAQESRSAQVRVGDERWAIVERRDGSRARGLTHLRNALLDDRSYDWSRRAAPEEVEWRHGLRFRADGDSDGRASAIVVLVAEDFEWIATGGAAGGGGAEERTTERASNRDAREDRPAHASSAGTKEQTTQRSAPRRAVASDPIAPGLEEVFGEWMGRVRRAR